MTGRAPIGSRGDPGRPYRRGGWQRGRSPVRAFEQDPPSRRGCLGLSLDCNDDRDYPLARSDRSRHPEAYSNRSARTIGRAALPDSTLIYKRLIRAAFDKKLAGPPSEAELKRWFAAVWSHSMLVGVGRYNFAAGDSLLAIIQTCWGRDPKTVLPYGAKLAAESGASGRMAARLSETDKLI